jgi:hypothetical protein
MTIEIGDSFTIDYKKINGIYLNFMKCKDPDKVFIVESFSKSSLSVYYIDSRKNIKCNCNNCSKKGKEIYLDGSVIRCTGISDIKLHSKRIQRERDNKLKKLGI